MTTPNGNALCSLPRLPGSRAPLATPLPWYDYFMIVLTTPGVNLRLCNCAWASAGAGAGVTGLGLQLGSFSRGENALRVNTPPPPPEKMF